MAKLCEAVKVQWKRGPAPVKGMTPKQFARRLIAIKKGANVAAVGLCGIITDGRVMVAVVGKDRDAVAALAVGVPAKKMGTASPERCAHICRLFVNDHASWRGVELSAPTHHVERDDGASFVYLTAANGDAAGAAVDADQYAMIRRFHPTAVYRLPVHRRGFCPVLVYVGDTLVGAMMTVPFAPPSESNVVD